MQLALVDEGRKSVILDIAGYPPGERVKNQIGAREALPKQYGDAPQYTLVVAGGDTDIKPVPAIELEARIRRAHSLIWAGGRRDPLGTHQGAISHEHLAEPRQRPEVRDRVPRQPQVRQPRHLRERPHVGHPVAVQQQHLAAVGILLLVIAARERILIRLDAWILPETADQRPPCRHHLA